MRLTFGRHKGCDLVDVPDDYLLWIQSVGIRRPYWLQGAVESELRRRFGGRNQQGAQHQQQANAGVTVADAVRRTFNRLALKYHPDRGGSDEAMRVVNEAHQLLRDALEL